MQDNKRIYATAAGDPATVPTRLAKIRDAAEAYNLDYRYVRRLVDERRVATVKLGKYRLVVLDDLDRLLVAGYTPAEAAR